MIRWVRRLGTPTAAVSWHWWLALVLGLAVAGHHLRLYRRDAALARALATRRQPTTRPAGRPRRLSILVAAWNEAERIEAHVRGVLALSYPDVEYVLCAGGSDGTHRLAARVLGGRGILLEQRAGEGKQRALRRCLEHATGELIYLTDGDCRLDDDALDALMRRVDGGRAAVTGRSRPFPEQLASLPHVVCQWAPPYYAEAHAGDISPGLLGRNALITRQALAAAGGFVDHVATGTDYHLARKLRRQGIAIAFADDSFVETAMPSSLGTYVRQQSRWLRNLWMREPGVADWGLKRHAAITGAMGIALLGGPVVCALGRPWLTAAWALLALHGTLGRLRYTAFVGTAEGLPLTFRHFAASVGWLWVDAFAWTRSLLDVAVPRRRARW